MQSMGAHKLGQEEKAPCYQSYSIQWAAMYSTQRLMGSASQYFQFSSKLTNQYHPPK